MFGSKKKEKEFKHSVGYDPIKFMNTWTSINPSYGCIWDCGYCVQEKDSWYVGNGVVKEYSPQMTIDMIVGHSMITKEQPLAMYNFSDPFLPQNQKDLVEILKGLEKKKYHNIVGLITKTLPEKSTLKAIKKLRRLRPVVIVSYANLPDGIERAPAKNRVELIKRSSDMGIPTLVYMRPLVKEWVTEKSVEQFAKQVTPYADGIIISGLMYTNEIKDKLEGRRSEMRRRLKKPFEMPSVSPNGAKHLDYGALEMARRTIYSVRQDMPLFTSTSCGVSWAYKVPCYNGYGGVRALDKLKSRVDRGKIKADEVRSMREKGEGYCSNTCYEKQRDICKKGNDVSKKEVRGLLEAIGKPEAKFEIMNGYINVYDNVGWLESIFVRQNTSHWLLDNGGMDHYHTRKPKGFFDRFRK